MKRSQREGIVAKPRKQNPIKEVAKEWWFLQQHWNDRVRLKLQHKRQTFFQHSILPMWLALEWVIVYEGLQATESSRRHNIRTAKDDRSFFRSFFFFQSEKLRCKPWSQEKMGNLWHIHISGNVLHHSRNWTVNLDCRTKLFPNLLDLLHIFHHLVEGLLESV